MVCLHQFFYADFCNNFMTMDSSPIELEAKSRKCKSHKGKKTTSKVQDDFLKIHDEKGKQEWSMKSF